MSVVPRSFAVCVYVFFPRCKTSINPPCPSQESSGGSGGAAPSFSFQPEEAACFLWTLPKAEDEKLVPSSSRRLINRRRASATIRTTSPTGSWVQFVYSLWNTTRALTWLWGKKTKLWILFRNDDIKNEVKVKQTALGQRGAASNSLVWCLTVIYFFIDWTDS